MIYKYTSVLDVISKVYRDTGSPDYINWKDLIEWAGEGLNLIGAHLQYKRRVTGDLGNPNLILENYKAKLPCDFFALEQLAINGQAAHYSGNTFLHMMDGSCCSNVIPDDNYQDLFVDNFANLFSNLGEMRGSELHKRYTYDINDDYITANIKDGTICMAYIAIPLDDNGYPQIPDHVSYIEAISKYCIMKIDYIGWRTGKISADLYRHSEREWLWYCGQAKAAASMPSIDKLELIKKRWVKLIPEMNQHFVMFKS